MLKGSQRGTKSLLKNPFPFMQRIHLPISGKGIQGIGFLNRNQLTLVSNKSKIRHMAKILFAPLHNSKNNSYLTSFELFPHKIITLGLILLLSLPFSTSASLAIAAPDEAKWSRFNIPTEGSAGDWVLADGSDVQHLTMDIDGTLYGYATPSGTSYT